MQSRQRYPQTTKYGPMLATGNFREGWERYHYRVVMGGNKWLRPEAPAVPWMG